MSGKRRNSRHNIYGRSHVITAERQSLNRILYPVGRLCAVLGRPAILFIANNALDAGVAVNLAMVFLVSAMAMVLTAADPHRSFYARRFGHQRSTVGLAFAIYCVAFLLLVAVGGAGVMIAAIALSGTPALAGAALAFFGSEKLADELMRLKLFEKNFASWGAASITRFALQVLGVTLPIPLLPGVSAPVVILALAAANFIVFIPQLPDVARRLVLRPNRALLAWLGRRALTAIWGNRLLWTIAVASAGLGYLDRLVALLLDRDVLPLFMLVVMAFSITQLSVDFFYVSTHRTEFLQRSVTARSALRSRDFLTSLASGFALSLMASAVILFTAKNGSAFPLRYIAAIAVLQLSIASTAIPLQIIYWSDAYSWILRVEVIGWPSLAAAVLLSVLTAQPVAFTLGLIATFAAIRLVIYVSLADRLHGAPAYQRK